MTTTENEAKYHFTQSYILSLQGCITGHIREGVCIHGVGVCIHGWGGLHPWVVGGLHLAVGVCIEGTGGVHPGHGGLHPWMGGLHPEGGSLHPGGWGSASRGRGVCIQGEGVLHPGMIYIQGVASLIFRLK